MQQPRAPIVRIGIEFEVLPRILSFRLMILLPSAIVEQRALSGLRAPIERGHEFFKIGNALRVLHALGEGVVVVFVRCHWDSLYQMSHALGAEKFNVAQAVGDHDLQIALNDNLADNRPQP